MGVLVVLLAIVACAHGLDKTRLWRQPPPMKGFVLNPYLGRWFLQFRSAPCSWSGSNEFTDYETLLTRGGKNLLFAKETMRNDGLCNKVTNQIFVEGSGIGKINDPIGDNWSGSYIVVATDYKKFSIVYGCTKMSVFGEKCDDPWLSVKTRVPIPGKIVIGKINAVLRQLWGTHVGELQRVIQRQPCFPKKIG